MHEYASSLFPEREYDNVRGSLKGYNNEEKRNTQDDVIRDLPELTVHDHNYLFTQVIVCQFEIDGP